MMIMKFKEGKWLRCSVKLTDCLAAFGHLKLSNLDELFRWSINDAVSPDAWFAGSGDDWIQGEDQRKLNGAIRMVAILVMLFWRKVYGISTSSLTISRNSEWGGHAGSLFKVVTDKVKDAALVEMRMLMHKPSLGISM